MQHNRYSGSDIALQRHRHNHGPATSSGEIHDASAIPVRQSHGSLHIDGQTLRCCGQANVQRHVEGRLGFG